MPLLLPPEIIVYFSAMIPFTEINASIPLGILLGLPSTASLFWSIIGNTTLGIILFKLLHPVTNFLRKKIAWIDRMLKKLFEKIHTRHSQRFQEVGILLLFLFVAIPGPGTGTYTSVLAAYLFNAPFWPSLIAICLGNIVNGLILIGGLEFFQQLLKLIFP